MTVAALAISSAGLVVSLVVLGLTISTFRRGRERSHVDWQALRHGGPGTFEVTNIGSDPAYDVAVEAWTAHEEPVTVTAKLLGRGESVVLTLPHREENGPDPVQLLGDLAPRLPGDHVSEMFAQQRDEMRQSMIESQVDVEVVWRSKRGTWSDKHFRTG